MITVDLNCDMGEGIGNDSEIMPLITSANIACGYHAGDESTIQKTIKLALENNVAIGAHPSFPDKENFGRRTMNFSSGEIYDLVRKQIIIIDQVAQSMGGKLNHVKPHGALYNMAAIDKKLSDTIVSAVKDYDSNLILFGLANSQLILSAKEFALNFKHEVFADRTYQDDGTLTPRTHSNALIENKEDCFKQVVQMIRSRTVFSLSGKQIPIQADTICLHGDGVNAVPFAKMLNTRLSQEGIKISNQ